jgi:hypothetical protein
VVGLLPNGAVDGIKRLRMSRKLIVIAGVLFLLAGIVAGIVVGHYHEPVYQGKQLSWWLDQTSNRARGDLFRDIGTNALPDLIQMLRSKDWPYRQQVVAWARRHELLKSVLKFGLSADETKSRTLTILAELGPPARPALPEVVSLLTNKSFRYKNPAIRAVSGMALSDQELRPLLPILSKAAADPSFAGGMAGALGLLYGFKQLPRSEILPLACELLQSPGASVRKVAIDFLNKMQPPPTEVVPDLCRLLGDSDLAVRKAAWDCSVAGTNAIPILDKQLHDADAEILFEAASRIGTFGPEAAASVERLRELCSHTNATVRRAAAGALEAITGEKVTAPKKDADINFNFKGMPVEQLIGIYEEMAGKDIATPNGGWPGKLVSVVTPHPLNKQEAMQLIEELLKQQAKVQICHGSDGSLTAVLVDPASNRR